MTCNVCGNTSFSDQRVDEVFRIDGHMVMVEQVPARVCNRCGEATFDRETVEQVRRTIHENPTPTRHESMDVFAFS
jgi:HTH-type transcriptional regulator / antitoxin MqsA